MYNLAIGAIFKNESHCIKEWIDHHLYHGASHFYLVNDESTDLSCEILQSYIDAGIVTLYNATMPRFLGRQRAMYNDYILPHFQRKEMKWLAMIDLDEFIWSPQNIDLNRVLEQCGSLSQIQFSQYVFASNGHIKQPPSLVQGFTKRWAEIVKNYKYFVNSDYEFTSLNIHHATFLNNADKDGKFLILDDSYFVLNHYVIQSREFWENVKCLRGDGDHYRIRTKEEFDHLDRNEVEDLRLLEQNEKAPLSLRDPLIGL